MVAKELSIFCRLLCLLCSVRRRLQLTPSSNADPVVIPNDLIGEILKFLPVKSLMRFKCVSKDWLSIITDPSFTRSYPGGFRGPIVLRPDWLSDPYKMVHYLNIDDTGPGPTQTCEAYHHFTVDHGGRNLWHTAVVSGLICFYNARSNTSWLYNIATRERVQLPNSSPPVPPTEDEARRFGCNCQLGFDPVSKLYKLLKLSTIFDKYRDDRGKLKLRPASVYFEILTVGVDSCWRTVDSLPPSPFEYRGLCVDGVMYGLELIFTDDCFLTAFHVAEERFLSVPLPPDFYSPPPNFGDWRDALKLPRFFPGPGPVLTSSGPGVTVRIDRYSYGGGGGGGGRDDGGRWDSEMLLILSDQLLTPRGILPNGKVLLADCVGSGPEPLLFLYDPIKRALEELAVINWNGPGITVADRCDFSYIEENIISLKRLMSGCN